MSAAVRAAAVLDSAFHARRHDDRLLSIAVLASAVVHLALVALIPGDHRPEEPPPRPLDVVIVTPPTPLPTTSPERLPPAPVKASKAPPPQRAAPRAAPPAPAPVPKPLPTPAPVAMPVPAPESEPVLTLPEAPLPAPSAIAVPQPAAQAASSDAKAAGAAPAARTGGKEAAPAAAPVTAPVYNAAYLGNPQPTYPRMAKSRGIEGTVLLSVHVSRDGRALEVNVARSSGSTILDNAAKESVKSWRFAPAKRGQEPIDQWVQVPVEYKLTGGS